MPIKKKVTGSGFTKRSRTVVSEPFGNDEMRAVRDMSSDREDPLDMIERNCKIILRAAGLPDSQRTVVWREEGYWREAPDGFDTPPLPGDESIGSLSARVGDGRHIREDSEEGYASRMLNGLTILRAAVKNRDAGRAAREGLYLGALWREADMKRRLEPPALRGRDFERGPKRSRLDDLGKAMADVLKDLGERASATEVWAELFKRRDSGYPPYDIIDAPDEIEPGVLYWKRRSTGKSNSLTFESFQKRLRKLKKKRENVRPEK